MEDSELRQTMQEGGTRLGARCELLRCAVTVPEDKERGARVAYADSVLRTERTVVRGTVTARAGGRWAHA